MKKKKVVLLEVLLKRNKIIYLLTNFLYINYFFILGKFYLICEIENNRPTKNSYCDPEKRIRDLGLATSSSAQATRFWFIYGSCDTESNNHTFTKTSATL